MNDVCYFYWGKWSNMLSVFWKGKAHFVSRFHGEWDLWEESYNGYAPLRKRLSESLDYAVFISKKGESYFHERYSACPTKLFRLGTKDLGVAKSSRDGWIRVLSCSTVYALKRVELICMSVEKAAKNVKIEWTHIGGGEDFEHLSAITEKLKNNNFRVYLLGQMTYSEVLRYYQNNEVDIFINLSANEGIPVSIMEAISCNIPVVATNVGGTSEIVCKETGILVSENPSVDEVANAILKIDENRLDYTPRKYWMNKYKADVNYGNFANFLNNLIIHK